MNILRGSLGALLLLLAACDVGTGVAARGPTSRAPRSVARITADLARELARSDAALSDWQRWLREAAGELGEDSVPELLEVAASGAELEPRLSAIELLRQMRATGAPALPRPALAWLGALVHREDLPALAEAAACRSLVAFGTEDDRQMMIERIEASPRQVARITAAWGLESARDERSIARLTEALALSRDALGAELAASALEAILLEVDAASLAPEVRALLRRVLLPVPEHPELALSLRAQATRMLARIGGGGVRATLTRVVSAAARQAALARVAARALAEMDSGYHLRGLAELMLDEGLSQAARDVAAETLVTTEDLGVLSDFILAVATERTRRVAESANAADDRKRAVLALAQLGAGEWVSTIAHRAWADEEPSVRAAAVVALGFADSGGAYQEILESQSVIDPSAEVRELALQALK